MPLCTSCGHDTIRIRRSSLERLVFADVFRCRNCGRHNRRLSVRNAATLRFLFSSQTHCPQCGNPDVQSRRKRDKIELVSPAVLSQLFRITGAPVRFCSLCRLQYFDWRSPRRSSVEVQRQN